MKLQQLIEYIKTVKDRHQSYQAPMTDVLIIIDATIKVIISTT